MASGDTFVNTVSEGLDTTIAFARTTREFSADVMTKSNVVTKETLEEGTGTSYREFLAAALTASNAGETDELNNPQAIDGSILTATPQLAVCETFIGRRVQARLNRKAYGTFGQLAQQAMNRKKDQDGLSLFSTFTTTLAGTGSTITSGHVMAGIRRITSNPTEPGPLPINVVLHGYHLHDLQSEIVAGVGTYTIPTGYTQETYMQGFAGKIQGGQVWEDGLITINATPDARGGIFAKYAVVLVQGFSPWQETKDRPEKGYGGTSVWLKDEYIYFERSPGNMAYGVLGDATAPTS